MKSRKERLHAIAAARFEIDDSLASLAIPIVADPVVSRSAGSRRALPWVVGILLATTSGFSVWTIAGLGRPSPPATRFAVTRPPDVDISGLAVSPDGRTVVFAHESGGLYRRELGQLRAVLLRLYRRGEHARLRAVSGICLRFERIASAGADRGRRVRGLFRCGQHAGWQIIAAEEGQGRTQVRGEEVIELLPGGPPNYTAPDVVRWHGAAPDEYVVQLTFMGGASGEDWFEPVSDNDYRGQ